MKTVYHVFSPFPIFSRSKLLIYNFIECVRRCGKLEFVEKTVSILFVGDGFPVPLHSSLFTVSPTLLGDFPGAFYGKGENRDGPWGIECSEVMKMLAAAWLMLSSLLYSLQLSSGSFPRPLTREEEQYYLDLAAKGDLDARNVLVERNLRLVAHIMNKG